MYVCAAGASVDIKYTLNWKDQETTAYMRKPKKKIKSAATKKCMQTIY